MTHRTPRPELLPWLALLGLATFACGGEPFVAADEQPLSTAGSAQHPSPVSTAGSASGGAGGSGGASGGAGTSGSNTGGGGSASGGAAGSGGSSIVEGPTVGGGGAPNAFALIDDLEGDFPALPPRDGRRGGWYTLMDQSSGQAGAAEVVAFEPARPDSRFAVRVRGGGFTDWGFELGVSLTSPVVGYDASRYCGVRFLAKGSPATWSMRLSDRLSVPQGGVCESAGGCYQFVGAPFSVDGEWREVSVPFAALRLADAADPRRLDASAIYDILFHFQSAEGSGFELYVDDLGFLEPTSSGCIMDPG